MIILAFNGESAHFDCNSTSYICKRITTDIMELTSMEKFHILRLEQTLFFVFVRKIYRTEYEELNKSIYGSIRNLDNST